MAAPLPARAPRLVLAAMARPLDGLGRVLRDLADAAAGRPEVALAYVGPRKQGSLGRAARTSPAAFFREASFRLRALGRHERVLRAAGAYEADALVLLHPQSFGFRRTLEVARRRAGPTWLYLMDSCWFCVRSYDHVEDEPGPCLRCLGGDLSHARRLGCEPFPRNDHQREAHDFVRDLPEVVRSGKLGLLVQCRTQADLVRRHFGEEARVLDVGLWASDWGELPLPFRVAGELAQTDTIMSRTFWVGVYPGLTAEMRAFVADELHAFVRARRGR